MLQLYIDLALSRLARHAIQPIQLYSYTAIHAIQHTALYSVPQRFTLLGNDPTLKGAPPLYLTPLPNGSFPWCPPD